MQQRQWDTMVDVKVLEGKQNSQSYIKLFKDFDVLIIHINYEKGYSVIHDNNIIHVFSKIFQHSEI